MYVLACADDTYFREISSKKNANCKIPIRTKFRKKRVLET